MPIRPCPNCRHDTPRTMEDISREARVWYYRCTACGHVWNVPKDSPDGPIQDVTLRTPQNAKAN